MVLNAEATAETAAVPAEPELIEVWRPGRFEQRERRQHHGRPHRRDNRGAQRSGAEDRLRGPPKGSIAGGRRGRSNGYRAPGAPAGSAEGTATAAQGSSSRGMVVLKGRHDGPAPRKVWRGASPMGVRGPSVEKEPDPNSPFAKLAALKAQLEADSKERPLPNWIGSGSTSGCGMRVWSARAYRSSRACRWRPYPDERRPDCCRRARPVRVGDVVTVAFDTIKILKSDGLCGAPRLRDRCRARCVENLSVAGACPDGRVRGVRARHPVTRRPSKRERRDIVRLKRPDIDD